MTIYTIGFTKSTAKSFFERIRNSQAEIVIDIRRNNTSQLAGFAKGEDLAFFLKEICGCQYKHDIVFAPSERLLYNYKKKLITWEDYTKQFQEQIIENKMVEHFATAYQQFTTVCMLCSEHIPKNCHRRLVAESLSKSNDYKVIHL